MNKKNMSSSIHPSIRPTGKWISQDSGAVHYCSNCGWALVDDEAGNSSYMGIDFHRENPEGHNIIAGGWVGDLMRYCPCCGAKMKPTNRSNEVERCNQIHSKINNVLDEIYIIRCELRRANGRINELIRLLQPQLEGRQPSDPPRTERHCATPDEDLQDLIKASHERKTE